MRVTRSRYSQPKETHILDKAFGSFVIRIRYVSQKMPASLTENVKGREQRSEWDVRHSCFKKNAANVLLIYDWILHFSLKLPLTATQERGKRKKPKNQNWRHRPRFRKHFSLAAHVVTKNEGKSFYHVPAFLPLFLSSFSFLFLSLSSALPLSLWQLGS